MLVCTGGEPLLQLDPALIDALHAQALRLQWKQMALCRAGGGGLDLRQPEQGAGLVQMSGHELKLVYPRRRMRPGGL
jgi:7-carboxy-7-deazaguanine synthase